MAPRVVTAAQVIVDTFDVSGWVGTIGDAPGSFELKERRTFGDRGFMRRMPGVRDGSWKLDGYADHEELVGVSALLTPADLGLSKAVSIALPSSGYDVAAGDWCQFGSGRLSSISTAGSSVGELAPFGVELQSTGAFVLSGKVGAPLASRTTSGLTGTAVALTGPGSGQSLYALLQVTEAAGTNLVVKVQSDDNSGFTSATDRITFATTSAIGTQLLSVAGDLSTETYWRVTATIASVTFSFACYFGIV